MPGRRRPLGLLARFALASAIATSLLGVGLALYLRAEIRAQALAEASGTAELIAQSQILPGLSPDTLRGGLSPHDRRWLDGALDSGLVADAVTRVKVWNRDGDIVYSDDPSVEGEGLPITGELEQALAGEVEAEITPFPGEDEEGVEEQALGQQLEVYAPLRFGAAARPAGAFELYLPYAPVAGRIESRLQEISLLILLGLGALYAVTFRVVATASRRLREQAALNERQALHDDLTDLPNRMLFRHRIEEALRDAGQADRPLAVMIMDLDRFKEVNDTLGHRTGDALLGQIGPRLAGSLPPTATVARLGGDEFGVLLPRADGADDVLEVAQSVAACFEQPFRLDGLTVHSDVSIGIALFPDHGEDADALLQHADVAMYLGKERHRACTLYAAQDDEYSPGRLALAGELKRAISAGELILHYQPKIDLRSGRTEGVEALVRWSHPERGLIPPADFIPLAERTGLIRPMTRYVLDAALTQCREWRDRGLQLTVAVNLSAANLADHELVDDVFACLDRRDVAPSWLELEITESTVMADPVRAQSILEQLRAKGVGVTVDDYGVGHASLAYLKQLPVDELKVDRSFVINMDSDESDAVIVQSTVALGHNLGLRVTAEGVESEQALARLVALGCDSAQGFHLGLPMTAAALTLRLLRDRDGAGLRAGAAPNGANGSARIGGAASDGGDGAAARDEDAATRSRRPARG